jgi:hypothetical protein
MTVPTLELYTHGLYADDRLLEAARAALAGDDATAGRAAPDATVPGDVPSVRSDKGPGNPNQDPDPPIEEAARA